MLLNPKVQIWILFPEIILNCLIRQCVPLLMDSIAITMNLQAIIGQMDEIVLVVQSVAIR